MAILIDDDNILSQDPSFLNRFEKYLITFDILLNKEEKGISDKIIEIINNIILKKQLGMKKY